MAATRPAGPFLCDVLFRIADSVYVGPENGMTPRQWHAMRVPLPPPDLPCRLPGRVAGADLAGREDALAEHYLRLVGIAEARGKAAALDHPFPYFALAPAILGQAELLADWPWSDSLPEAAGILENLAAAARAAPGDVILDDEDQGWRLRMVACGEAVRFVEWDAEGPPPRGAGWQVDAAPLAGQAAAALERLRAVHTRLVRRLGRDFWS